MSVPTLGLATIGQSPRDDVRPAFEAILGPAFRIIEAGALDGCNADAVAALAPVGDDIPLATLANGEEVRVGKRAITPLLQGAIDRLVARGTTVIALLCTGHFEGVRAPVMLIEPDRVQRGFLDATLPHGRLGIVMPDAGQMDMMRRKWERYDLSLAVASPYQPPTHWDEVIGDFRVEQVEAIVLDCMGFGPDAKAYFADRVGVPVVCAQTATAHLIRDLLWAPAAVPA